VDVNEHERLSNYTQLSLSYKAPPTKATPLIRPDVRGTEKTKILLNSPKEKNLNFEGKNIQLLFMCQLDSIKFNLQYMFLERDNCIFTMYMYMYFFKYIFNLLDYKKKGRPITYRL
jgi:hypothetical protein